MFSMIEEDDEPWLASGQGVNAWLRSNLPALLVAPDLIRRRAETFGDGWHTTVACGIYFLLVRQEIVYVGRSVDISRRMEDHAATALLRRRPFDRVFAMPVPGPIHDHIEWFYFRLLLPPWNMATVSHRPIVSELLEWARARGWA